MIILIELYSTCFIWSWNSKHNQQIRDCTRVPKVEIIIRRNVGLITGINIFIFIVKRFFCDWEFFGINIICIISSNDNTKCLMFHTLIIWLISFGFNRIICRYFKTLDNFVPKVYRIIRTISHSNEYNI